MKVQTYNNFNNKKSQNFGAVFITDLNCRIPQITLTEILPDAVYLSGKKDKKSGEFLSAKFHSVTAIKLSKLVGELKNLENKVEMYELEELGETAIARESGKLGQKCDEVAPLMSRLLKECQINCPWFDKSTVKKLEKVSIQNDIISYN